MTSTKIIALSKLYRLKLADEIYQLLTVLPAQDLIEIHKGNHIYHATGQFKLGEKCCPGSLLIYLINTSILVSLDIYELKLKITQPFTSRVEQNEAPKNINRIINTYLN